MPLYEYDCPDCQASFELLVRMGEAPRCPSCDSPRMAKKLSVPAAHTKGAALPVCEAPRPAPSTGGFCGRGMCGLPGCGPN